MKKVLFVISAAILTLAFVAGLTSCKSAQFGVAYAVTLEGDGDGVVDVTFPQGRFAMDGTACLDLRVSSDSSVLNAPIKTKAEVLASGDPKQIKALELCNQYMEDSFTASPEASGTFDIYIKGYVKETLTGIGFEVERHLTNRTNAPLRTAAVETDPYMYVK